MMKRGILKTVVCLWMSLCIFASTVNGQASQRVKKQCSETTNSADSEAVGEFNRMKQKQKVSDNLQYIQKVQRVGNRIVDVARCGSPELPREIA